MNSRVAGTTFYKYLHIFLMVVKPKLYKTAKLAGNEAPLSWTGTLWAGLSKSSHSLE